MSDQRPLEQIVDDINHACIDINILLAEAAQAGINVTIKAVATEDLGFDIKSVRLQAECYTIHHF